MLHSETGTRLGIKNEPENAQIEENILKVANFLQALRNDILVKTGVERTIRVLSCYRSPELNKAVGGSKTSAHMHGLAADITIDGMTPKEVCHYLIENINKWDQIILEFDRWTHIGIATDSACRKQILTAKKVNGTTKYLPGIQ